MKSNSPIVLNDRGKKLVEESGFKEIYESIKDELIRKIEEKKPHFRYDVQGASILVLYELRAIDYEPFNRIKTYCFNNGVEYSEVLSAGSILLRDYYLEKHPEIKD